MRTAGAGPTGGEPRYLRASFLISVLISAALLGMFPFMTFFLQQSLGYSALRSGVAYLPFSAGIIVAAGFAAQFLPRLGPRIIVGAGGILATASMAWLIRLDLDSTSPSDEPGLADNQGRAPMPAV